uniref:Collagenase n=1 Tax=Caligus clemensi TaxID=344056 RepID=C1C0E0_CALCM|nr:Collagenase precursor [Caligus clemensi]
MKLFIGLIFAIASVLYSVSAEYEDICGIENDSPYGKIIGGQEAAPNQFPWVVAIQMKFLVGNGSCTGSIINKKYILTAAHCVEDSKKFTIFAGSHDYSLFTETNRQIMKASRGIPHPNFVNNGHDDIAIIELDEELEFNEFVRPICLPKYSDAVNTFVDEEITSTGWGLIKGQPSPVRVPQLHYVDGLRIIDNSICAQTYGPMVNENLICIDSSEHKGICNGDSGGPMNYKIGEKKYIQIGVADFVGGSTCDDGMPEGFARVTSYLEWIEEVTGRKAEQ